MTSCSQSQAPLSTSFNTSVYHQQHSSSSGVFVDLTHTAHEEPESKTLPILSIIYVFGDRNILVVYNYQPQNSLCLTFAGWQTIRGSPLERIYIKTFPLRDACA